MVGRAREAFTRRIRPPLVIKALLDMKGEILGSTKAQPLTLGMLPQHVCNLPLLGSVLKWLVSHLARHA